MLKRYPVDEWAAQNLVRYFDDQRRKGARVGTDRQVVLELFPDDPMAPSALCRSY